MLILQLHSCTCGYVSVFMSTDKRHIFQLFKDNDVFFKHKIMTSQLISFRKGDTSKKYDFSDSQMTSYYNRRAILFKRAISRNTALNTQFSRRGLHPDASLGFHHGSLLHFHFVVGVQLQIESS